jgi:hypothetical protein
MSLKERHDEVHVIGSLNDGTVPTALRLTGAVTDPNGLLYLAYETAGAPVHP